jgi:hypothetical protein
VGPISATQPLLAQVRRMLVAAPPLVSPSLGQEMDSPAIRRAWEGLVVWDEVGLPPTVWDAMEAAAAGVPVVRANLDWLGETASAPIADNAAGGGDSTGPATGAAAVALALTGRTGGSGAGGADFLHPRLIPPRQQHLRQRTLWLSAGFAAAVVAMAAIGALSDLAWVSRQVNRADDRLQVLQPALSRARPYVSTMQFASSFQPGSSRFLACLGDLTVAVPEGGSTYLTSFSLNADMSGAAAGRASSEQDVLAVLDKLRAVRRFDRLNCKLNQHQVQGRPRAPAAVPAPAATPGLQPPGAAPPGAAPPAAGGSTAPPGAPAGPTSDVTFSVSFSYLPRA